MEPVKRALLLTESLCDAVSINDVNNMSNLISWTSFYGRQFSSIVNYPNQSKQNIVNKIKSTFNGTKDSDVSYLYISCHGGEYGNLYLEHNKLTFTPSELRQLLDSNVKGTVVLMVDACYSGGLFQRSGANDMLDDALIRAFSMEPKSGELATPKYKIISASRKTEVAYGTSNTGFATWYWLLGSGWNPSNNTTSSILADSDGDSKVTLRELYEYSYPRVQSASQGGEEGPQHVAIYPENDNFVLFGRY